MRFLRSIRIYNIIILIDRPVPNQQSAFTHRLRLCPAPSIIPYFRHPGRPSDSRQRPSVFGHLSRGPQTNIFSGRPPTCLPAVPFFCRFPCGRPPRLKLYDFDLNTMYLCCVLYQMFWVVYLRNTVSFSPNLIFVLFVFSSKVF